MCSELTPRAHIPYTRIPQFMQPWLHGGGAVCQCYFLLPRRVSAITNRTSCSDSYRMTLGNWNGHYTISSPAGRVIVRCSWRSRPLSSYSYHCSGFFHYLDLVFENAEMDFCNKSFSSELWGFPHGNQQEKQVNEGCRVEGAPYNSDPID